MLDITRDSWFRTPIHLTLPRLALRLRHRGRLYDRGRHRRHVVHLLPIRAKRTPIRFVGEFIIRWTTEEELHALQIADIAHPLLGIEEHVLDGSANRFMRRHPVHRPMFIPDDHARPPPVDPSQSTTPETTTSSPETPPPIATSPPRRPGTPSTGAMVR